MRQSLFTGALLCVLSLAFSPVLCTRVGAQNIRFERAAPRVTQDGRDLPLAWFGGLNAPQFNAADLDGDGTEDLLLFDRAGQQLLALRRGDGGFSPAPELLEFFPGISNWLLARDYNQDGIPDLFAHAPGLDAIRVYRGAREADGRLSFTQLRFDDPDPVLYFPFDGTRTPIFVTGIDYPAVADVDFDGDLDILTFSTLGGYLELYQNQAIERGLGPDTFDFRLADQCYGGFFESGLSPALNLSPESGDCFRNAGPGVTAQPRHSGSTVLALDYDGNGLMDLLLGDISFPQLILGLNNGTVDNAWITDQDANWPVDGVSADISTFPAAFHLDVDLDGDRDLIGAPTSTQNGADIDVGWLYENRGSDEIPDFVYRTNRYLTADMIDVGTKANVTGFDYDADGRPDLIVGNNNEYSGTNLLDSRLRLFRNVTPPGGEIAFELIDEDYLELSRFQNGLWAFAPTFGDLDDDGDDDAVVGARDGKLIYFENLAGPGQRANFARPVFEWFDIDASQLAKPVLADLDRDGLLDLVVGGFDGRIRFYRNGGTPAEPLFDPDPDAAGNALQLGGIDTRVGGNSLGNPRPAVVRHADHTLVFAGNRTGAIQAFRFGVDTLVTEAFTKLADTLAGLQFGGFADPAFADFDGDGSLEMVVGMERGGVEFFRTNLNVDGTVPVFPGDIPAFSIAAFPNPASEFTQLSGWRAGTVDRLRVYDIQGRLVYEQPVTGDGAQVQWEGEKSGVYVVRLSGGGGVATKRILVTR